MVSALLSKVSTVKQPIKLMLTAPNMAIVFPHDIKTPASVNASVVLIMAGSA